MENINNKIINKIIRHKKCEDNFLSNFPFHLSLNILKFLDIEDLKNLSETSLYNMYLVDHKLVWKHILLQFNLKPNVSHINNKMYWSSWRYRYHGINYKNLINYKIKQKKLEETDRNRNYTKNVIYLTNNMNKYYIYLKNIYNHNKYEINKSLKHRKCYKIETKQPNMKKINTLNIDWFDIQMFVNKLNKTKLNNELCNKIKSYYAAICLVF